MAYAFKHGDRPLDGYTIQRAVGSGGFGEVYYALSDGGREVALKYLKDNPQVELRGVSNCINLKSPHLISIFDVRKSAEGDYFLIMEYCSGPSLRDLLIAEPHGFGAQKAAYFVREIAKGLAYLHDRGIVHRDLKPGNIFFDDGYVKIGDYGLSKFISISRHSAQTASVGTVHYMAPEIGSGNYSRGVDIYALGVILYEMLLGRVPFEGSTMGEVLMKHLTTQPAVDELPNPFANVIRKALLKDPNDRYQNVNEMVDELLAVDDVQKSLAGFSAKSLEGAVRRGLADTMPSPMPSPNPMPRVAPVDYARMGAPADRAGGNYPPPLPDRLAKKLNRISQRIDRKMAKLGGKNAARSPQNDGWRGPQQSPMPPASPNAVVFPASEQTPLKRLILAIFVTIGLSVILGLILGSTSGKEEVGASAGMLVLAMSGGILLARKAVQWFGVENGPIWSERLVALLSSAPLIAIGAAPVLDMDGSRAIGMVAALVFVSVFSKWDRVFTDGSLGELKLSSAFGVAFTAFIAGAIATAVTEGEFEYVPMGAAVAGVVALCLQPTAWWIMGGRVRGGAVARFNVLNIPRAQREEPQPTEVDFRNDSPTPVPPPGPSTAYSAGRLVETANQAVADATTPVSNGPEALRRWAITRAFWGLLGFTFMCGSVLTFILPLAMDMTRPEVVQSVVTCIGLFVATAFCMRKTTPYRREGIWRETVRPFFIAASFFAVGTFITVLAGGVGREDYEMEAEVDTDLCEEETYAEHTVIVGPDHELVKIPKPARAPRVPNVAIEGSIKQREEVSRLAMVREKFAKRGWSTDWLGEGRDGELAIRMPIIAKGFDRGPVIALSIVGIVFSSIVFLILLFFTGRNRRQRPFVQSAGTMGVQGSPAQSGRPNHQEAGAGPVS